MGIYTHRNVTPVSKRQFRVTGLVDFGLAVPVYTACIRLSGRSVVARVEDLSSPTSRVSGGTWKARMSEGFVV